MHSVKQHLPIVVAALTFIYTPCLMADNFLDYLNVDKMAEDEKAGESQRPAARTETAAADEEAPTPPPPPPNKAPNVPLPEGWEPVSGGVAQTEHDKPAHSEERPAGPTIPLEAAPVAPASSWTVGSPWGEMPFCSQGAYQYENDRGAGFAIKVPSEWSVTESRHDILGGLQHRYTAPDGMTSVVVVTLAMDEQADINRYLAARQIRMLSSFKLMRARSLTLGRRTGIGVYYRGILLMRDVACHLFITRYKGKGYVIYGYYFDQNGGKLVGQVMNSLRIY